MTAGSQWLQYANWAVVGDVLNENKYAYQIVQALEKEGYTVLLVNPRSRDPRVYRQLLDCQQPVEVVDLVIHPKLGLEIVAQAATLGIKRVLIQPGAESEELLSFCRAQGIEAVEGCILQALAGEK